MTEHSYRTGLTWSRASGAPLDHEVTLGERRLTMSADAPFGGDGSLTNPEQLLVAAVSSCQLMSFLTSAQLSGVEVLSYTDDAEGVMPEGERPLRITHIRLRPHVVTRGASVERIERLLRKAHAQCFIAASVTSEITMEPTIEIR